MRASLEEIEHVLAVVELVTRVGKVDATIAGDVEVVGEAERHVVGRRGQNGHLSLGVDGQQALVRIGDNQVARRVEVKTQWSSAGVGECFDAVVRQQPHDPAVEGTAVDAANGIDVNVLGTDDLAASEDFALPKRVVFGQRSRQLDGGRCVEGHRINGRRPAGRA